MSLWCPSCIRQRAELDVQANLDMARTFGEAGDVFAALRRSALADVTLKLIADTRAPLCAEHAGVYVYQPGLPGSMEEPRHG